MFKALYFGTIKPLFAGFQDADRREMQNLFLQRKVANLVSDPAVWRAELGIPIAQIYNTERILHDEAARDVDADASLTGILNRRAVSAAGCQADTFRSCSAKDWCWRDY